MEEKDLAEVKQLSVEMAKLYGTFTANAPRTSESGEFNLMDFISSKAAVLLAKFLVEQMNDKPPRDLVFLNGALYGIMLAELGLGAYVLREKSGDPKTAVAQ